MVNSNRSNKPWLQRATNSRAEFPVGSNEARRFRFDQQKLPNGSVYLSAVARGGRANEKDPLNE